MFNIAVSNLSWDKSVDQQVFEVMKNLRISNLEISPFRDSATVSEANKQFEDNMSKLLKHYGIHIVAFQSLLFRYPKVSLFKDVVARNKIFKYLMEVLEFSNRVGSTIVVFGSPKNKIKGKLSSKAALDIGKNFFRKLADRARMLNITFCIEPTPAVYGADFICNTREAIEFVKGVNHQSLKINLDIGSSILNNEKVEEIILGNIKHIGHVHISEPHLRTIEYNPMFHKNISRALNNGNYRGIVSVEMLPAGEPYVKKIYKTLSFVKSVYQSNYEKQL